MKKKVKEPKNKYFHDKKSFIVGVDMFYVDIVFCINMNEEEILKHLKKICGEDSFNSFNRKELDDWDSDVTAQGRMIPHRGGFLVLLKVRNNKFRRFIADLTHEITHVTHYLLRDRRIPLQEDTEEVYTYLTQYILEEALNKSYT